MKTKKMNSNTILLLITIALFVVMYAIGCVIYGAKGFTHFQTFLNILINNAGLLCVACGTTCIMLTGGIDISVGALIAMDCMFLAVGNQCSGALYPCVADRHCIRTGTGILCWLSGDPAVYCYHGRYVLCAWHDCCN